MFPCLLPIPWLVAGDAQAFTTRIHIALANEVHDALVESGDGRIELLGSSGEVVLSKRDADAIVENPLQFRAGAIGPDNFVFPAMTDQTHGIGLRPYDQCNDLYAMAESDAERAYALGCFLHGSTDAVAHHYVNWLTGETFTLNPITAARGSSFENVVRHIVAEAMIQEAALVQRPDLFEPARIHHDIPNAFVQRALVSTDSLVWQRMVTEALPLFQLTQEEHPDLNLKALIEASDLSAGEVVALMPILTEVLSEQLDGIGPFVEEYLAELQDSSTPAGAELRVRPGPDGQFNTSDDVTDCSVTCPALYAAYFLGVGLIEPEPDGSPPWVGIASQFADDLDDLPAVYVQTVGNLSALVTSPVSPEAPRDGDLAALDPDVLANAFEPFEIWVEDALTLKEEVIEQILPDWVLDIRDFFDSVGVQINFSVIVKDLIAPLIDPIKEAIREEIEEVAKAQIEALIEEIEEQEASIEQEYEARLDASTPPGLDGHALDHFFESGLWITSFNIAAATLSDPSLVLPIDEPWAGVGGASFDASYTVSWMQISRCPIGEDALPMGYDVQGLLSVSIDGVQHTAVDVGDAPIECHNGDLMDFGRANAKSCSLTKLDELLGARHRGSVSRAFPPEVVGISLVCGGYAVLPGTPGADEGSGCDTGSVVPPLWVLLVAAAATRRRFAAVAVAGGLLAGCSLSDPGPAGEGAPTAALSRRGASNGAAALREALGKTAWHTERVVGGIPREVQLEFRADVGLWVETVSPYRPGMTLDMRSLVADPDGTTLVSVSSNPEGWPPNPVDGRKRRWTADVGRKLTLTHDGESEVFESGGVPMPTRGFLATLSAFEDEGAVDDAFCDTIGAIDRRTLFDFARGSLLLRPERTETDFGIAPLARWPSGSGFSSKQVPGFETSSVDVSEQFVVHYRGVLDHPGGRLSVRERDDEVEGAMWAFVGSDVDTYEPFLEVHSLIWPDDTSDEPSRSFPAGPVDIEVIVVRCSGSNDAVDVQIDIGNGWVNMDQAPIAPLLDPYPFPKTF